MKKLLFLGFVPIICLSLAGVPALAQPQGQPPATPYYASPADVGRYGQPVPPPGAVIFDTLILRPLGLAAIGIGFGMTIATLPFTALNNTTDAAVQNFLVAPSEYTFERPLGYIYPVYAPPPIAYPPGPAPAGKWVTVPGQWVDGRWVPSHRVWIPVNP